MPAGMVRVVPVAERFQSKNVSWWPWLGRFLLIATLILFGLELGARAAHVDDVPLYLANNRIGYIIAPNQSGNFLLSHGWAFNELSMGTHMRFRRDVPGSVLLIGDSVVLGGNPFTPTQRLGAQLSKATGRTIWPISAGSWALQNELQYVTDHLDVVRNVDQVVLVSNSGDFDDPSSWANELTHPRERHVWTTWQLFRKYVWPPRTPLTPPDLKVTKRALGPLLARSLAASRRPWIVLIYPDQNELRREEPCGFRPPAILLNPKLRLFCLKKSGVWQPSFYRDAIHPTTQGTHLLALLIGKLLMQKSPAPVRMAQ